MSTVSRNPEHENPRINEDHSTSLQDYHSDSSSYRPGSSKGSLYSKGGHQGYFTNSNPYFEQLRGATEDQDIDAMYSYAVQWEADYHNLQEQRAYNREVLEEQREYDSPVNAIARQRAAGINPDLAGSSGSVGAGSSAQMNVPDMADQSSNVNTKNAYDTGNLVLSGINTAAGLISSFTGGFSSIISSIDTMKTLPSRIALNDAQAGLANSQANEITQLLEGKKEGQKLGNQGQALYNTSRAIQNSTATLQQLAQFSDLISPDTADMAPYLKALGVEESNIQPYSDLIKQMHANPQMRDKYARAELSAKWSEEENTQYTTDLIGRLVSSSIKIKEQEQQFSEDYTAIQARVQSILAADPTYSTNSANLIIDDSKQAKDAQDFAIQQFKRDVATYGENIQDVAWSIKRAQSTIDDIYKKAGENKRQLSPVEKATVEDLQTTVRQMRVLGSQQVQQLYGLEKHANRLRFYSEDRIRPSVGESEPLTSLQRHNIESRIVFDDILTDVRTGADIAVDVSSRVLSALSVAAAAYAGGKGVAKGRVDKTVRKQVSYGSDADGRIYEDTRTWEIP